MATIVISKDRKVELGEGLPTVIIGERINPAGKKKLAEDLSQGKLDVLVREAISQKEAGADILDVNVAASGVDETAILPRAVLKVLEVSGLPVCIDSSNPEALKKALEVYPHKTLVNSVTGQEKSLKAVLPLVKKFGACVVGLTMDDSGIPKTADKRFAVAKRIMEVAKSYGIPQEDIVIDCLCLAQAAQTNSAVVTLEALTRISRELGVATVLGVSNISFGMPDRKIINLSFLAEAISQGLNAAIVDPTIEGVVETILASDFLAGRDSHGKRYLRYYREKVKTEKD
ncbi:MAG: dihydropteroate synthase [Elusimicrobiota bacterium]|nr:dihydropteroate synthase [Elusimicrobiota bacterium]MDH5661930.1 dihydropteroate synthase [Elusimicrobiota bacterium]